MTTLGNPGGTGIGLLARIGVAIATALIIVTIAVLALLTPIYIHAALDRSGSAGYLGVEPARAHALSDRTVGEMLLGPATFAFPFTEGGPIFYDAAEAGHLRDARAVLWGLLASTALAVLFLVVVFLRRRGDPAFWRAVSRGGLGLAVACAVIGVLFLVAFDAAFTLFHELFFPGGNWSFDFATQRMVQLYPIPFWELSIAVLGAIVIGLGLLTWWLARRHVARVAA